MESADGCYAEKIIKNIEIKKGNCKFMSYKDIACKKEVKQISMRACVYGIKTKDNRRIYK